ncbi:hypothetical protein [Thalassoroseus pseudoceratinae]|uniref:hypothetical protein n=1 Tax=Thalassoroseus pseudoceratinae TaxID=2713176 RepID=UPI001422251A|nr:hypothetical protein [Thalassoroseus pseudoceratinae]
MSGGATEPVDEILMAYVDLISEEGLRSEEVRKFEEIHSSNPEVSSYLASVRELHIAERIARFWRAGTPILWAVSVALFGGVTALSMWRASNVSDLSAKVQMQSEQISVAKPWGWIKPNVFSQETSPAQYLRNLASVLERDWQKIEADTTSRSDIGRRLAEFRLGCTTLLFSELEPLPPEIAGQIRELCHAWSAQIDDQLADVEEEFVTVSEAKTSLTRLISSIVSEFNNVAESLS